MFPDTAAAKVVWPTGGHHPGKAEVEGVEVEGVEVKVGVELEGVELEVEVKAAPGLSVKVERYPRVVSDGHPAQR